jgi:glycosyltransferase involved in cell wall biosynthesis
LRSADISTLPGSLAERSAIAMADAGQDSEARSAVTPLPRVSVVISTYNGARFIREAVESILKQSYTDFELIVVNDGSTDATPRILAGFDDERMRVVTSRVNRGIATAQNSGLALARGEYVALMDHDDVSLPDRLQRQIDFLDRHPEISLVGAACLRIDEQGAVKSTVEYPGDDIFLKWSLVVGGCPLFHTAVVARRSALEQIAGYTAKYLYAGDYELFSRLSEKNLLANLAEPLVKWREHGGSASSVNAQVLADEAAMIARENVAACFGGREIDEVAWTDVRTLIMNRPTEPVNISTDALNAALSFLLQLQDRFYGRHNFLPAAVRNHRRSLYLIWGRHFLALACRGNGTRNFRCRLTLLKWSAKLLLGVG